MRLKCPDTKTKKKWLTALTVANHEYFTKENRSDEFKIDRVHPLVIHEAVSSSTPEGRSTFEIALDSFRGKEADFSRIEGLYPVFEPSSKRVEIYTQHGKKFDSKNKDLLLTQMIAKCLGRDTTWIEKRILGTIVFLSESTWNSPSEMLMLFKAIQAQCDFDEKVSEHVNLLAAFEKFHEEFTTRFIKAWESSVPENEESVDNC